MTRPSIIRDSRGFTLMELVIGMALAMIVLLAAFSVIDRAFAGNKSVADREDGLQRGRSTLERMTRQLRSMTCVNTTNAVTAADDSSISFYTYMGDPTSASTQLPEWHTLAMSGSTITEQDYKVTGVSPSIAIASAPYETFKLTNVSLAPDTVNGGNLPLFRY